jgi:hypothetical protein
MMSRPTNSKIPVNSTILEGTAVVVTFRFRLVPDGESCSALRMNPPDNALTFVGFFVTLVRFSGEKMGFCGNIQSFIGPNDLCSCIQASYSSSR